LVFDSTCTFILFLYLPLIFACHFCWNSFRIAIAFDLEENIQYPRENVDVLIMFADVNDENSSFRVFFLLMSVSFT